jgi:hypothetical protein
MLQLKLRLVSGWYHVLVHSWSVRLMYVVAALSFFESVLPWLADVLPIPHWLFTIIVGLVSLAAAYSRVVYQGNLQSKVAESQK